MHPSTAGAGGGQQGRVRYVYAGADHAARRAIVAEHVAATSGGPEGLQTCLRVCPLIIKYLYRLQTTTSTAPSSCTALSKVQVCTQGGVRRQGQGERLRQRYPCHKSLWRHGGAVWSIQRCGCWWCSAISIWMYFHLAEQVDLACCRRCNCCRSWCC